MMALGRIAAEVVPRRLRSLQREISPVADAHALLALVRLAREYRPHVVHTHLAKAGMLGRIAARIAGVPIVLHTFHGSVLHGYFGQRESAFYLRIERALARLSTRIVAITESGRQELLDARIAPSAKVVVVPLGLDLDPLRRRGDRAAARSLFGIPLDVPVVGIVARLVPIKDVGTFLRAVARARRDVPELRAIVVGDGSERASLEMLASSLGIAHACRFTGWRADVDAILAALDVLALTSLNEGSPVSLIEGMAAGKAVVATDVGGVADVVRPGTGLLVPPRDDAAAGEAFVRLARDPALRARIGAQAAMSVYPRFDASRLVGDTERLYAELVSATR